MQRRRFLALSAASGLALGAGGRAFGAAAGPAAAAVVVTDISPTTDAANLFAVLETFRQNGLWVTCALRTPEAGALDGYGAIVRGLLALGPGIEIALELPELSQLSPHFQGRAAFHARRLLATLAGEGATLSAHTILCDTTQAPTDPVGVRSAGVRNVLVRPDRRGPTRSEAWANGVARFSGGTPLTPWSASLPAGGGDNHRLFYISADGFSAVSQADLRRWASNLATAFFDAELRGEMSAMPVSELQLRDDFRFTRQVAVRLVGDTAALRGFGDEVERLGIPVLFQDDPEPRGYWVPEPGEAGAPTDVIALGEFSCAPGGRLTLQAAVPLPSGIAVLPVAGADAASGMDDCAVFELRDMPLDRPVTVEEPLIPPGGQDDLILSVHAGALGAPGAERVLLAGLEALGQDGITRFVPLDQLVNTVLSYGAIERRFRRTHAATLEPETAPAPVPSGETGLYMEDARLAWAFFEAFTDPNTGLCPATANVHTGGDALTWVTMWDVGSQINALVAAHRLGLIETGAFEAAARRILFQIAGRRSQGRLLPHGVIRTDLVRRGSSDFDGCDAGRLLAGLDTLRRHSALGDEIAALVSSWDLDRIVIDETIHSVTDGELKSTYKSHCAHYAARAFGRWGMAVKSPYQTLDGRTEADGRMAMLEAVAGIGPLGAEPLLLEALELGMSAESAWLAEVLHVAQVEEFEETGALIAVSEMPIRRAPWFVYLGLQLGRETREWGIDVVGGDEKYRTKDFLDQNMALSSKAAYLWAAYRPGPYADALVAFVRERARLPIGFASNVSASDDGVAAPFTDLNTNAVILQAIAHKLAGDGATPQP